MSRYLKLDLVDDHCSGNRSVVDSASSGPPLTLREGCLVGIIVQAGSVPRIVSCFPEGARWPGRSVCLNEIERFGGRAHLTRMAVVTISSEALAELHVVCAVCKRAYDRGVFNTTQASDCASMIKEGSDGKLYLTGHYGSDIDGLAYEVVPAPRPELFMPFVAADPVCDGCVRGYGAVGMLVFVGDFLHDESVSKRVFGSSSLFGAVK